MIEDEIQGLTSRMDPVPHDVLTMAKESLAWRDTDAALAQLVAQESVGVRGADEPEMFTFTAGDMTIEVEVSVTGQTVSLLGQLVPPQPARIKVDHTEGPTWTEADHLGRFAAMEIARGHARLTCYPTTDSPAPNPVQTAWTLI